MQKFKDFRKSGTFTLASGVEVPGELSLKGGATTLGLYSSAFFHALVSFAVDDAPTIFYDFDAFGSVSDARPHMEKIIEAKKEGRTIEIGDHPQIFYFTGKHDIFVVDTVLGKVSATHGISYTSPGPEGINVRNTIRLNVAFDSKQTVEEAISAVIDTLRFLEVIAGRP